MTKAKYLAFQTAVNLGLKGLENVSTGACPGCPDCGLEKGCTEEQRQAVDEGGFSWGQCDACGSTLGGNRYPAHGWMKQMEHVKVDIPARTITRHDLLVHLNVCEDCMYYINYGKLDDQSMMEIEEDKS